MSFLKPFVYRGESYMLTLNKPSYDDAHLFRGKLIEYSSDTLKGTRLILGVIDGELFLLPDTVEKDEGYVLSPPFPTINAALAHITLIESLAA